MKKQLEQWRGVLQEDHDNGFSLLEVVVAVSIMLILAVVGTLGYQGYQSNARDAAVETAAQQVYTAGQAEQHMPGTTDLDKVAADYNKSSSGITTAIAETENGICASAVFDSHPEHTAERGDCADAEAPAPGDDNNGDENTGDESDNGEDNQATGIGAVENLQCNAPDFANGKLAGFSWDAPKGLDGQDIEYDIEWSYSMVDWGNDGSETTTATEFSYKFFTESSYSADFSITPRVVDSDELGDTVVRHIKGNAATGSFDCDVDTSDVGGVMKIKWDTNLFQVSNVVLLPISGSNVSVDWGDGTVDNRTDHAYKEDGEYVITITGTFSSWGNDREQLSGLTEVLEWKDTETVNLKNAFRASGITHIEEIPDGVHDMSYMFAHADEFDQDISGWDTSSVENMHNMFIDADAFNNGGKALDWKDTSSVENMRGMFQNSSFNQDISEWDTSSVEDMSYLFSGVKAFNHDLSEWDVSSVKNMSYMFAGVKDFNNGGKALDWKDTSSVENMSSMFSGAEAFNQPIGSWNTSSVEDMSSMFSGGIRELSFNQDLSDWDTSSVKNMYRLFTGAREFNRDISDWDVSNVANMSYMFGLPWHKFNNGGKPLDWKDTSSVENMHNMFTGAKDFDQDVSSFIVSEETNVDNMFLPSFTNGGHPLKDWMIRGIT